MTKELKGIIEYDDEECRKIYLINDGEKIDLVDEFEDAAIQYGNEVQVNYWITENPCTKEEILEKYLKKVFGAIDAENEEYYTGSWTYGSQTSWSEYETRGRLRIGGHDLFHELSGANGQFIILELNFKRVV